MKIEALAVDGALSLDLVRQEDDRGFFARSFCEAELAAAGVTFRAAQTNISFNRARGTLRGMHFTRPLVGESKIVRVTSGRIYDVAIDLRPASGTYLKWVGLELSAENRRAFYIPDGCAHGFVTLTPDAEVHYLMGAPYRPGIAAGVRFDDPAFGVVWPATIEVIAERDRTYPDYVREAP
jgi:dTDP-4-dehydrorhamnose 3,5-epimerase